MQGIVSEFDPYDGVGLIDTDDGNIVLFNMCNLDVSDAALLDIGVRVRFLSHEDELGVHADAVKVCE